MVFLEKVGNQAFLLRWNRNTGPPCIVYMYICIMINGFVELSTDLDFVTCTLFFPFLTLLQALLRKTNKRSRSEVVRVRDIG